MKLERGMKNGVVLQWQKLMNNQVAVLGLPVTPLKTDGDFGPATEARTLMLTGSTVVDFQEDICLANGQKVPILGAVAPWGTIQQVTARASTFGGPDDPYDHHYGQSFLKDPARPCDIPRLMPKLTNAGLFRPEALDLQEWPGDKEGRFGLSWALANETACYCALRANKALLGACEKLGDSPARVAVFNPDFSKGAVCFLTDYGPASDTGCDVDLSNFVFDHLGLKYRGQCAVLWADDDADVGLYG